MAAAAPEASGSGSATAERLRMMCSHGGCFAPCGPDGAVRYVGGETRVLAVPRGVSFRELAAWLGEMAGGKTVPALKYRLADDEEVLVSVSCDEELAHLRDEYDRLEATRPSAIFRVFFSGVQRPQASGRPPLAPRMRRVQSDPCTAARVAGPAPPSMRRVQSAQDLAGYSRFQPRCYDKPHRRRDQYVPMPAPPMRPPLSAMSKNSHGARPAGQEPAPEAATRCDARRPGADAGQGNGREGEKQGRRRRGGREGEKQNYATNGMIGQVSGCTSAVKGTWIKISRRKFCS